MSTPSLDRRLICARGGVSDALAANSMAAFEAAIASGADLIETDVRAAADGRLVLARDPPRPGDEAPVDLRRLLERARGRIGLALHLTQDGLGRGVGAALAGWRDRLIVTARAPEALADLLHYGPSLRTGLIVAAPVTVHPVRAARSCGAEAILWEEELATPTALRACAEARLAAWVWTVNAPFRLAEWMAEPALEAVITEEPALAVALRPPAPVSPK